MGTRRGLRKVGRRSLAPSAVVPLGSPQLAVMRDAAGGNGSPGRISLQSVEWRWKQSSANLSLKVHSLFSGKIQGNLPILAQTVSPDVAFL